MRNLALVCGALAVVSSIVSVNLWRELHAAREVNTQLRGQLTQGRPAPSGPIEMPQATAPTRSTPVVQPAAAAPSPAPSTAPAATAARTSVGDALAQSRDLLKDPEYRRAALAQRRLNMPQNYPGLVEELNLTPEQADELYDLLAEAQITQQAELVLPINQSGQPPDLSVMQEYTRRSQELQTRRDDQIAALLGSAGRDQFKAYEQTVPARMQAQNIQRMMETAGMPLTAAQMKPVTDAYIADQQRQRDSLQTLVTQTAGGVSSGSAARLVELQSELQVERNRSLIEALRPHVTAQQLERMQAQLDQQLAMTRASSRLMRERMEAQAAAAGTVQGVTVIQAAPAVPAP